MAIQSKVKGRPAPYAQGYVGAPAPTPRDHAYGYKKSLLIADLPYIAHAITEHIHDEKPEVVAAADRGARLFGLAVHRTWRYLYPTERFPTLDGKLHFARWSKAVCSAEAYTELTAQVLRRSGAFDEIAQRHVSKDPHPLRFMLLDDWFCRGTTILRVHGTLTDMGMRRHVELIPANMCGSDGDGRVKMIGDPRRDPRDAYWNNNSSITGVDYVGSGTVGRATNSVTARETRAQLYGAIDTYHRYHLAEDKETLLAELAVRIGGGAVGGATGSTDTVIQP